MVQSQAVFQFAVVVSIGQRIFAGRTSSSMGVSGQVPHPVVGGLVPSAGHSDEASGLGGFRRRSGGCRGWRAGPASPGKAGHCGVGVALVALVPRRQVTCRVLSAFAIASVRRLAGGPG